MATIPLKALLQRLHGDRLPVPFAHEASAWSDIDRLLGGDRFVSRPVQFAPHRGGQASMPPLLGSVGDELLQEVIRDRRSFTIIVALPFIAKLRRRHCRQCSKLLLYLGHDQAAAAIE